MNVIRVIAVLMVIVAVVCAILAYFKLPERVAIDTDEKGAPTETAPKIVAVLIPFLIAVGGAVLTWLKNDPRYLVSSAVGVVGSIVEILFVNFGL